MRRVDIVDKHALCPDATKKTLEGASVGTSDSAELSLGPHSRLLALSTDFAVLDAPTRTWSFKLGPDESFAKRFPATAKAMKL